MALDDRAANRNPRGSAIVERPTAKEVNADAGSIATRGKIGRSAQGSPRDYRDRRVVHRRTHLGGAAQRAGRIRVLPWRRCRLYGEGATPADGYTGRSSERDAVGERTLLDAARAYGSHSFRGDLGSFGNRRDRPDR